MRTRAMFRRNAVSAEVRGPGSNERFVGQQESFHLAVSSPSRLLLPSAARRRAERGDGNAGTDGTFSAIRNS
jgi:hypothetical protein